MSILDSIKKDNDNFILLERSIHELRLTEAWIQIYALPDILNLLYKEDLPLGLRKNIKDFCLNSLDFLPIGFPDNSYVDLIDLVASRSPIKKIISKIAICAAEIQGLPLRTQTEMPYLDLKLFFPEIFLLSILRTLQINEFGFSDLLETDLDSSISPIDILLQNSFEEYAYGRYSYRLSAYIVCATSKYSTKQVVESIWINKRFNTSYEPDLIQTIVDIEFGFDIAPDKRNHAVARIINESIQLRALRFYQSLKNKDQSHKLPIKTVGINPSALDIIYWQLALWDLASIIDKHTCAAKFSQLWSLPPMNLPESIIIRSPLGKGQQDAWKFQIDKLLSLQVLPSDKVKTRLSVEKTPHKEQREIIEFRDFGAFFSPWLRPDGKKIFPGNKRLECYPSSTNDEVILRLLGCAVISIRILVKLDLEDDNRRLLAALIAHASDVIENSFNVTLSDLEKTEKIDNVRFKPLILFALRQLSNAGQGRYENIPPTDFLNIINYGVWHKKDPQHGDKNWYFTKLVLPEVMLSWIKSAYNGAVDNSGPGRWIPLVSEVYKSFENSGNFKHYFPEQINAAIILRFLAPNYEEMGLTIPEKLRKWMHASTEKGRLQWGISQNQLLLTYHDLHPDEWVKPDWSEDEINPGVFLVRSIERINSLGNGEPTDSQLVDQWVKDLITSLYSITEPIKLNRFTRLRLLEILDNAILENNFEARELISFVLLEYGSPYELKKLFDAIYSKTSDGKLSIASGSLQLLREIVVQAIFGDIYSYSEGLESRLNVQDPQQTVYNYSRHTLLREMLLTIAHLTNSTTTTDENNLRLNGLIRELYNKNYKKQSRSKFINLVAKNRTYPQFNQLLSNENIKDWFIRGASFNPNDPSTILYCENYEYENLDFVNLFEKSRSFVEEFSSKKSGEERILGVVINVVPLQNETFELTFNCGLPQYKKRNFKSKPPFIPGDYVLVPIKHTENGSVVIVYDEPIKLLKKKNLSNGAMECSLSFKNFKENGITINIPYLRSKESNLLDSIDWNYWESDLSARFRQSTGSKSYSTVFMNDSQDGLWRPIERDIIELVLCSPRYTKSGVIILSFVANKKEQGDAAQQWVFSSSPGMNYTLSINDFIPSNVNYLMDALSNAREAFGLLLAVRPVISNRKVFLSLVFDLDRDETLKVFDVYPNLHFPTDFRNCVWRNIINPGETLIAYHDQVTNEWFIKVDVPGYPDRIYVKWLEHRPESSRKEAEFVVEKWDEENWKLLRIAGNHILINQIRPHNRDWKLFLERWLSILENKSTNLVTIERFVGKPNNSGMVRCLTPENITIDVEVESITMKPINNNSKSSLSIGRNRQAKILNTKIFKSNIRPDFSENNIPPEAITHQGILGILINVPHHSTQGTLCDVIWRTENEPIVRSVDIKNLDELRLNPGCFLRGESLSSIDVFSFKIRARAVWHVREWENDDAGLIFLGNLKAGSNYRLAAEGQPGELVLLKSQDNNYQYLSVGDGIYFGGGVKPESQVKNLAGETTWVEGRSELRRATLEQKDGTLLFGICEARMVQKNLIIEGFRTQIIPITDDTCMLRREFTLRAEKKETPKFGQKSESDIWRDRFNEYLDSPLRPLSGKFVGNQFELYTLQIPTDSSMNSWTSSVEIEPEERELVKKNNYPKDNAQIVIYSNTNDKWRGSFRRVPALRAEEFRNYLDAEFNQLIDLRSKDISLHYVGKETTDPITGEILEEPHHRFEWGYGYALSVPESEIRIDEKPFEDGRFLIFHGDIVRRIEFSQTKNSRDATTSMEASNDDDASQLCAISIKSWDIGFAQSTQLYKQRKLGVIHILHLLITANNVIINYVEGLNEERVTERDGVLIEPYSFEKSRAELSIESQKEILGRLSSTLSSENEIELIVLGRLDINRFNETLGYRVVYNLTKLSFMESDIHGDLLNKSGELVFMRAGEILPRVNDIALEILPLEKLSGRDIGSDFSTNTKRSNVILRRRFSVREDLLEDVLNEHGKDYFSGSTMLVHLSYNDNRGVHAQLISANHGLIPPRNKKALQIAIETKNGSILAAVSSMNNQTIELEVKPGIFVKLEITKDINIIETFERGSIIRITQNRDKFYLSLAAFSDLRYVSNALRPVIILPKNTLRSPEDLMKKNEDFRKSFFWSQKIFTIGGLPNIEAALGNRNNNYPPNYKEGIKILLDTHPKIGYLWMDSESKLKVQRADNNLIAGSLLFTGDDEKMVQLKRFDGALEIIDLKWRYLTFSNASILKIKRRIRNEFWEFHDHVTSTWIKKGTSDDLDISEFTSSSQKIKDIKNTAQNATLFFEKQGDNLSLRYSANNQFTFGYPASELLSSLRKKIINKSAKKSWYTVAGISRDSSSIWIEICPGRISELPINLLTVKSSRKPLSLNSLYIPIFSIGDQIELELASDDALSVDYIILNDWISNHRTLLGNSRAFLPVSSRNHEEGSVILGAGIFTLELPEEEPQWLSNTVILSTQNEIQNIETRLPARGDVVLVGLNNDNDPIILGLPEFRPLPDFKNIEIWKKSVFSNDLLTSNALNEYKLNKKGLRELIIAAGGSLPVTVEGLSTQNKLLFFSLRLQELNTSNLIGKILIGRLAGSLGDGKTVIFDCGGAITKINISDLILGLPTEIGYQAIEKLRQNNISVFARIDEGGKIRCRTIEENNREISMEPICVIEKPTSSDAASSGLICRSIDSMQLYWLLDQDAAWVNLPKEYFEIVYSLNSKKEGNKIFRAAIIEKNKDNFSISVNKIHEREFEKLEIGSEIAVTVVTEVIKQGTDKMDRKEFIVTSDETQAIMLLYASDQDNITSGEHVLVEVVKREFGHSKLTTALAGKRLYTLNLSENMMHGAQTLNKLTPEFEEFLQMRTDPKLLVSDSDKHSLSSISNQALSKYLTVAYYQESQNADLFKFRILLVDEWLSRNEKRTEWQLHEAIMTTLILARNSRVETSKLGSVVKGRESEVLIVKDKWSKKAKQLAQEIGRRSLCSMHSETLSRLWVINENNTRDDGMWGRLSVLKSLLKPELTLAELNLISRFTKAISLRSYYSDFSNPLALIADSFSMAIGKVVDFERLLQNSETINFLLMLHLSLPKSQSQLPNYLSSGHEEILSTVLEYTAVQGLNIFLLSPLPPILNQRVNS